MSDWQSRDPVGYAQCQDAGRIPGAATANDASLGTRVVGVCVVCGRHVKEVDVPNRANRVLLHDTDEPIVLPAHAPRVITEDQSG